MEGLEILPYVHNFILPAHTQNLSWPDLIQNCPRFREYTQVNRRVTDHLLLRTNWAIQLDALIEPRLLSICS